MTELTCAIECARPPQKKAGGAATMEGSHATAFSSSAGPAPGPRGLEPCGEAPESPVDETPRALKIKTLFGKGEEATPAILALLWETQVGRIVAVRGERGEERRRGGGITDCTHAHTRPNERGGRTSEGSTMAAAFCGCADGCRTGTGYQ